MPHQETLSQRSTAAFWLWRLQAPLWLWPMGVSIVLSLRSATRALWLGSSIEAPGAWYPIDALAFAGIFFAAWCVLVARSLQQLMHSRMTAFSYSCPANWGHAVCRVAQPLALVFLAYHAVNMGLPQLIYPEPIVGMMLRQYFAPLWTVVVYVVGLSACACAIGCAIPDLIISCGVGATRVARRRARFIGFLVGSLLLLWSLSILWAAH